MSKRIKNAINYWLWTHSFKEAVEMPESLCRYSTCQRGTFAWWTIISFYSGCIDWNSWWNGYLDRFHYGWTSCLWDLAIIKPHLSCFWGCKWTTMMQIPWIASCRRLNSSAYKDLALFRAELERGRGAECRASSPKYCMLFTACSH